MKEFDNFYQNKFKFYLGIYILFGKKVDDAIEVNNKSYDSNMIDKMKNSKSNLLIIKYKGIFSLDDENFNKFIKNCLKLKIPNAFFFFSLSAKY